MLVQLLSIARNAFVEGLRQPIFLVLVLLAGVLQIFTTWSTGFSMGYEDSSEAGGDNKLMLDIGLASVFVLGTLLAAFVATAVINREIENKTVLTVVSKPVGRPVLVLGKYIGVAGAILVAVITMLLFLMFGIRHGVMSTAADSIDQPVMVFGFGAVVLSVLLAAWCNFFYGWSFPQTAVVLMLPLGLAGYLLVLAIGKDWQWQPLSKDFKPQILLACACLVMAILVLTAVATAASTRLGQVMTIVICAGVLVGSMLSNYFIGRHAFRNTMVATIRSSMPEDPTRPLFNHAGDTFLIDLEKAPTVAIKPGDSFYYGPSPNGAFLSVATFAPFQGRLDDSASYLGPTAKPAVVVTSASGLKLAIRNLGNQPVPVKVPPQAGDYVFLTPTRTYYPAMVPWVIIPNMQYFWLLDAVSQNQKIPPSHVGTVAIYALTQIAVFLSLAVVLFQRRDVG